jgi:hypothetical protein
MSNQAKCLTPGCTGMAAPVVKTGQCLTCYSKAKKAVEAGTTTWDELAKLGLTLPTADAQAAAKIDPFNQALAAARLKEQ